jgi:guanine deaminase
LVATAHKTQSTIHQKYLRSAIAIAKKGIAIGQTPFGACIVKGSKIVALNHNKVWKNKDITAHAEIQVIRSACRKLRTIDLSKAVLYSTCEPCPMCFSAIHWAGIRTIYYGAQIGDAKRFGFRELDISNQKMKTLGQLKTKIVPNVLKEECLDLFKLWKKKYGKKTY